ncbi:4Fe-4S binding protein [Candidatus Omnitrophota bacterium]
MRKKKVFLNIVLFITLLIAIGINIYGRKEQGAPASIDTELQSIMPEGDSFKKKLDPFLYYEIYKKKRLIGHSFNTKDAAPKKKGYGGPIEILVGLDKAGDIENLKVLLHNETPMYADGIKTAKFLDQFKGKGHEDRFIVGEDIDGITQATISSRAVSGILKASVDNMQAVIAGSSIERAAQEPLSLDIDFHVTVSIITFLLIAFYLKVSLLRYIGLFASIVYFGFCKANFIAMSNLGSIFLWNLPDLNSNITWYVFIFSGLILTFLLGGFYCSYMCPFGGLQIFLNKIFRFNIEITPGVANRLRKIRFFLLWILTMVVLVSNNPNVVIYEPFSTVFLIKGSLIAWCIALIILVLSLFHHRPFCSYFCSAGAFLDLVSKTGRRIFRRR